MPENQDGFMADSSRDVEAVKREYRRLLRAAEQDTVTGLLNRNGMLRQAGEFLNTEGLGGTHALFMIDLDNFKQINDTFGHQYGDKMLKDAAAAIKTVFRSTDIVARIGGDEFMALMKDAGCEQAVIGKAGMLVSSLQFSSHTGCRAMELTSSVGAAMFEGGFRDFAELYKRADTALYMSKHGGKNCFSIYGTDCRCSDGRPPLIEPRNAGMIPLCTLLEYMDGGLMLTEVDGGLRFAYVSPSVFSAFGKTGEAGGIGDIMSAVEFERLKSALICAAQSEKPVDHVCRMLSDAGARLCHIRSKRIPAREEEIRRVISVITDITELKSSDGGNLL